MGEGKLPLSSAFERADSFSSAALTRVSSIGFGEEGSSGAGTAVSI